jgi:hypothetical protein
MSILRPIAAAFVLAANMACASPAPMPVSYAALIGIDGPRAGVVDAILESACDTGETQRRLAAVLTAGELRRLDLELVAHPVHGVHQVLVGPNALELSPQVLNVAVHGAVRHDTVIGIE